MTKLSFPKLAGFLTFAVAALTAAEASAHHVVLTAQGICDNNTLKIQFTVDSEALAPAFPYDGRHNNVVVTFNSVTVFTGAFTAANSYKFTSTVNAPGSGGDTVAVSATAVGPWLDGLSQGGETASTTVTLPTGCGTTAPGTGRFTGGGKSIDTESGLKVTKGFTIHCDLILSNNLEINWPKPGGGSNQFHMLEHTAATCTDDPGIEQKPPAAPVDRIDGVGTGRYNGDLGYTVYFTLIDAGEPGSSDMIAFRIVNTQTGSTVLLLPLQNIIGGNVQAHYDQPHK